MESHSSHYDGIVSGQPNEGNHHHQDNEDEDHQHHHHDHSDEDAEDDDEDASHPRPMQIDDHLIQYLNSTRPDCDGEDAFWQVLSVMFMEIIYGWPDSHIDSDDDDDTSQCSDEDADDPQVVPIHMNSEEIERELARIDRLLGLSAPEGPSLASAPIELKCNCNPSAL